jgi:pyruvate-ferredoxin/flavodoxin oxidoreductase
MLDGTMDNNITLKKSAASPIWFRTGLRKTAFSATLARLSAPTQPSVLSSLMRKNSPKLPISSKMMSATPSVPSVKGLKFRIQVSTQNCVGCGVCVAECLANKAGRIALEMVEAKGQFAQEEGADYLYKHTTYKSDKFPLNTVKGVGFLMPYMEVSGAARVAAETPYYRWPLNSLAVICSSPMRRDVHHLLWFDSATPFVKDANGEGVAWANRSLKIMRIRFGMRLATIIN